MQQEAAALNVWENHFVEDLLEHVMKPVGQLQMQMVQACQLDLPGVQGRAHWLWPQVAPTDLIALLGHLEQLISKDDHVSDRLDPCDKLLLPSMPKPPSSMISQE